MNKKIGKEENWRESRFTASHILPLHVVSYVSIRRFSYLNLDLVDRLDQSVIIVKYNYLKIDSKRK